MRDNTSLAALPGESASAPAAAEPPAANAAAAPLAALCVIARLHQIAADPAHLAHQLGWPASHQVGAADLLLAAKHIGLKAKLTRSAAERLNLSPLPALALLKTDAGAVHAVVLAQCDGQRVLFQDPSGAIQGGRPSSNPSAFSRRNGRVS